MWGKRAAGTSRGVAARRARASDAISVRIEFHAATPERWADVESLFGPRGACAGCWCQWPRLRGAEFSRGKGESNRRALKRQVSGGSEPGIIAYVDGAPAAWCAIAPRESYPRIANSRLFADHAADARTWSVVCFFVAREHRGRGLTVQLLDAAAAHAKRNGARWLEGYPVDSGTKRAADAFVWTGLASAFAAAGFTEVARPSPTRPLMRRTLGRASAKIEVAASRSTKPSKASGPLRSPRGRARG